MRARECRTSRHVIVHSGGAEEQRERGGARIERRRRRVAQYGHQFTRDRVRVHFGRRSRTDFTRRTVRCRRVCFKSEPCPHRVGVTDPLRLVLARIEGEVWPVANVDGLRPRRRGGGWGGQGKRDRISPTGCSNARRRDTARFFVSVQLHCSGVRINQWRSIDRNRRGAPPPSSPPPC